ncbi:VWA domain-containing protein [Phytohabitans sp. ZYX-F-186]|uniref:VWA domain-containing protein n=1 Tax=Phytohabitans maris TaxID=3071409 RepID=A0ABU0ZNE2_9ACTN|nr:VWA domain-containing protein [Phytohabitans sp. ZYX-F-186]MDQ7908568.1 VWA domain-containing protein [Phytohabitans sp. ZYX-F-186]
MLDLLAGLVRELRAVGIPVSPTEHIDAARALGHVPVTDRPAVRAALAATLVKSQDHVAAFETVFGLYFTAGPAPGFDGLDADSLDGLLHRALRDRDRLTLRALAAQLVTRYAGMEPGRPVAGTFYLVKTLRQVDLDGLRDRLVAEASAGASPLDARLAAEEYTARTAEFRTEVEDEIRRRLVADRGAEAVARTLRRPLPEDVDFLRASRAEVAALRDTVRPLARKLSARLARRRRGHRTGPLDFRRTARRSMSTGGTPMEPVFRRPHPARPELMVVADISGSVSAFAAFTLQLVDALRSEFAKVRSFVFVDGVEEITDLLRTAEDLTEVTRTLNGGSSAVWLDGRSDYGHALATFAERWGPQVKSRSTVIVLGDARNNYHAPRVESLAAVAARARHLYWLNPEPETAWDDGDSVIGQYAAHCDGVFECRNLRQLKAFVERLD